MSTNEDIDNCFGCKNKYYEPRLLPCGNSLCHFCVTEKTIVNVIEFECIMCKNIHQIPEDGFPLNSPLIYQLNKRVENDKMKDVHKFKTIIADIGKKLEEAEFELSNGEYVIKEHCIELRRQVQLAKEEKIQLINDTSDDLIKRIDIYESDRLTSYLKVNKDQFTNILSKIKSEISRCNENMLELVIGSKILNRELNLVRNLQARLATEKENIQSLLFKCELLEFFEKYKNENVLGDLELSSFDSIDFNKLKSIDLKTHFDLENVDDEYETNFFVTKIGFIITIATDPKLKILLFDQNRTLKRTKKINVSRLEHTIGSSDSLKKICIHFFKNDQKYLAVFDENLEQLHEIQVNGLKIGNDDSLIFIYFKETNSLSVYDWSLKLIENNWHEVKLQKFLSNPSFIQYINDKYYIVKGNEDESETLQVISENGILLNKIDFQYCCNAFVGSNNRFVYVDQDRFDGENFSVSTRKLLPINI